MKYGAILVIFILSLASLSSVVACEDDCKFTVKPKIAGDFSYITGGIGICEARMMRDLADGYPLDVVFIQKLGQREEFLADVKVKIKDQHHHWLLDMVTEGPYLFMKLPPGKYLIIAENNGDIKQQWVKIRSVNRKKVLFWWPILQTSQ